MAASSSNQREREIFERALDIESPGERLGYVKGACADDAALLARLQALLLAHDESSRFLPDDPPGAARAPVPALEEPGTVIGRYTLLERLGEGGFGVVYVAEQREPVKRRVALKIIKLGLDTRQVVARFEAERQALALMDHPNIAKVLDGGATETGRPYFVMELVRGIPITEYCDANQLPADERLKLFILVCQAIQHAHQKGIIHRDIKPSNILLTVNDGVAVPKVIDFGIAKAIRDELTEKTVYTQFQQFIGTPAYVSPEQAAMTSLDIDTRSDIYTLGVLLYELLVGKTPFDGKELLLSGLDEMRRIIREKEPIRPSTRLHQDFIAAGMSKLKTSSADGAGAEEEVRAFSRRRLQQRALINLLRGDVDWIVMKCLEKDRTRRYETASGLAADIRRYLANEPVTARPPSHLYRFQKLARRNKLVFAAVSSVAAALVLGVVVSTWQAVRATRASAAEKVQHKLADMQLALQAWEEGDLQRASDLIAASRPAAGQTPGFEWRYLTNLCQDQSYETFGGPNHQYRSAQFYNQDLLLLNEEKKLTLQDLSHGQGQLLLEDSDGIWAPALCSGNTNLLATVTNDGRIKIWDLALRRVKAIYPPAPLAADPADENSIITFSRDGRWLASAISRNSFELWDLEPGSPAPVRTLQRYAAWACGGVFSADGRRLYSGGSESMIRAWNVASGVELGALPEGHTSWLYALAMSPDGLRLASGGADSRVIVWDVLTGQPMITLLGHIALVRVLAFSPDQRILASAGRDQTIRLWDMKTGQQVSLLRGHGAPIGWLSFSPDGQSLVSLSSNGRAKLWHVKPGQDANTFTGVGSSLEVALSPDGRLLASVGNLSVNLWDLATGRRTVLPGHTGAVMAAAFSPDGRTLASCSHDETVRLWGVNDKKLFATLTNGFPAGSLAFSPDGRTLIVGGSKHHFLVGNRGGLQFWDVPSQRAIGILPGDPQNIVQIALSLSGTLLATGHTDGHVTLWDAQTRQALGRFDRRSGRPVMSLGFSPAEPLLAASDWDGNIELYDTAKMEMLRPAMKAHSGRVTSLVFSPDGQTLASAGEGGGLKLWHVATRQVALTLKGHVGTVKGIDFSRDGNFMASCGLDGTVRLWPAAILEQGGTAATTRAFTDEAQPEPRR